MASKIARILTLTSEEEAAVERTTGKLQTLAEWASASIEAVKDTPVMRVLGETGEIAKEWSGTAKLLSTIIERITTDKSPETLGWIACTMAYREAATAAIRQLGVPKSHLPFSGEIWRDQLKRLRLEDPSVMRGFSLRSATAHPFMRSADQALVLILTAAGYDPSETRQVLRAVRTAFTQEIATLLSAERMKDFAGFTQWLQLDTNDARLYASLAAHLEQQRSDLEDKPALDVEPFSIESVYIEPECGVLPWKAVHGSEDELFEELPKPFDESSAPREDLMASVLRPIHDLQYRDWIVLMGPPGAGKSTFTKKLCVRLGENGFIPVRVPLQHLRVDMDLFDAIRDTIVRFGGDEGLDFEADLFARRYIRNAFRYRRAR